MTYTIKTLVSLSISLFNFIPKLLICISVISAAVRKHETHDAKETLFAVR